MEKESFVITTATLNAVLGYLGSRPYQEVSRLIQSIYNETNPQLPPAKTEKSLEVVEGSNEETA